MQRVLWLLTWTVALGFVVVWLLIGFVFDVLDGDGK